MAPINPVQILDAFTPLLTENGGIKSAVDQSQFEKIYDIMKNFSTKLVSKCIYYQILMSTSSDVLEKFLKIGGWDLICLWVKSSRDSGNVTFLLDLLKLLQILPMNIDRLRENECPKIVKKLCKHENQDIALKANQIIKKWTKIIQQLSEKNPNNSSNGGGAQTKEKKRKSIDSTADSSNGNKKTKTESDDKTKTAIANNTDVYETCTPDETILVINSKTDTSIKDGETVPITVNQLVRRPVTAKVKQGKFRLDLSIPSTTNKSGTSGGDKVKNNKMNKSSLEARKLLKNDLKSNLQQPLLKTPLPSASKLKDSMSFMDALSMMPVVGKKRRKSSNIINNNNNIKESENNNYSSINKQSQDNNDNIVSNKTNVILSSIDSQNFVLSDKQQFSKSPQVGDIISNSLNLNNETSSVANQSPNSNNNSKNDLMIMNNNTNNNNSNNNRMENSEKNISSVSNENQQQKSPPRFSFYKDILDEKCKDNEDDNDQNGSQHDDNTNGDNNQESQKTLLDSANVAPVDSLSDNLKQAIARNLDSKNSDDPLRIDQNEQNEEMSRLDNKKTEAHGLSFLSVADGALKPKPILCYVKKNSKKNVRWPDDDTNLEQVKYFELDETERINVTRPSVENMKRFDMKHEAQMMSEAKKGRCFTYAPWRLIAIDLDPINVPVERGKDSREKHIQMERMKTTLECFYFHNQIPDSPDEPENSFELISDSNLMDKPRIIPLEDENTMMMDRGVQDYASTNTMPPTSTSNMINHLGAIGGGLALAGMMEQNNLSYNNINDNVNYINTGDMNNSYLPYNSAQLSATQLPPIQAGVNPNYLPPPNTNSYQNHNTNYLPPMQSSANNQGTRQFDGNSAAMGSGGGGGGGVGNNSFPNDNAYQPMFNNYPANSQTNTGPLSFGTSQQQPLPNGPGINVQQPPSQAFVSQDFNPTNSSANNYGVFQNQNQSPNLFQNNPPLASTNFYNNNPSSQNSTTNSENDYSNYWPETSNNNSNNSAPSLFPSNNGPSQSYSCSPPPQQAPPPMKGGVGQRFRPRGSGLAMGNTRGPRGGGAGMFPKNGSNTEMCRFFFKNGKCKFDNRCNYSHVIPSSGDQKPPVRF